MVWTVITDAWIKLWHAAKAISPTYSIQTTYYFLTNCNFMV